MRVIIGKFILVAGFSCPVKSTARGMVWQVLLLVSRYTNTST